MRPQSINASRADIQVLREVRDVGGAAGGVVAPPFSSALVSRPGRAAIERCVAVGWLIAEGLEGHRRRLVLTAEGRAVAGPEHERAFPPELSQAAFAEVEPPARSPGGWTHPRTGDRVFPSRSHATMVAHWQYLDERRAMLAAVNWARVGQRVLVVYDRRVQLDSIEDMEAIIVRLCDGGLRNCVYVQVPPTGRRRKPIERMIRLDQLQPL